MALYSKLDPWWGVGGGGGGGGGGVPPNHENQFAKLLYFKGKG